jgi:predicted PurR-regulated permease PerM
MLFAFGALATQAQSLVAQIAIADKTGLSAPAWLENVPVVGNKLAERWHEQLETPGGVSGSLQHADTSVVFGWVQTLGQLMAHHLFIVSFAVLLLFFLYRGGDSLAMRIDNVLREKLGDGAKSYIELGIVALRATVNGMAIVALFDGVLTGVTYAVAGVHNAHVWGAVTGLFAMIPFVGYAVVAVVALVLIAKDAVVPGLAVGGLGVVILFVGDKVVRPMLVGNATKLGFAWVLMGSLGGLEALGLLGLFVGPVVLAMAGALWDERAKRARYASFAQSLRNHRHHLQQELSGSKHG